MIKTFLSIVDSSVKLWSEERRTRFMDENYKLRKILSEHENKSFPDYSDIDVDRTKLFIETYMESFNAELQKHVVANLQSKV